MVKNEVKHIKKIGLNASTKKIISDSNGHVLLTLARHTLMKHFCKALPPEDERLKRQLDDPEFLKKCATFVTLKKKKQLRGCIGTLVAKESIAESVRHNAINAAFHDPRFAPLNESELEQIVIEVSILTSAEPLLYENVDDLLVILQPGIDGVTIRKGAFSATFLPQVWDQIRAKETFLSHLCLKAGLSMDAWRKGDLDVEVYQVQYFEEE